MTESNEESAGSNTSAEDESVSDAIQFEPRNLQSTPGPSVIPYSSSEHRDKDAKSNSTASVCDTLGKSTSFSTDILIHPRDPDTASLLDAIQKLYINNIKPLEDQFLFNHFDHDSLAPADLLSKPQVLVLGQYSTGKTTFLKHFLGRDFPSMNIALEPSTESFHAVMAGKEDRIIKGPILCHINELPFSGLEKFGSEFLDHFEASTCKAELLEHLTFIDTPGLLGNENQHVQRGYIFTDVAKWFADRSDVIILVFDVYKLDISDELRSLLQVLKPYLSKIRIILNKAQEVDTDHLIKVYGALMWGLGRALGRNSSVPKVFVGSYWDGPTKHPESSSDDALLEEDKASLWKELMQLPKNIGLRRVNDMIKRVQLLKAHACILDYIHRQRPRWLTKKYKENVLNALPEIFQIVQSMYGLADRDIPDIDRFRSHLEKIDFSSGLPKLSKTMLVKLDRILTVDIQQIIEKNGNIGDVLKVSNEQDRIKISERVIESYNAKSSFKTRQIKPSSAFKLAAFLIIISVVLALVFAYVYEIKSRNEFIDKLEHMKLISTTKIRQLYEQAKELGTRK